MNREQIEAERPHNGPAITPEHVESLVISEDYHLFPNSTLTVCMLTLRNGFTVTGESACVTPANFNAELGRGIARSRALDKVYQLEGYLLQTVIDAKQKGEA